MASIEYHVNTEAIVQSFIVRHTFPTGISSVWQSIRDRASEPLTWSQSVEDPFVPGFAVSPVSYKKIDEFSNHVDRRALLHTVGLVFGDALFH